MNPIAYLADIMLEILKFFSVFTGGNYGMAIVLLTIAINMALYPLTLQGLVQMSALQKLQPRVKELQKKHKDKPDVLQKETMELYKQEKVNPLGGCLPMLLKIPFMIAIFFALRSPEFAEVVGGLGDKAGFLWMPSLVEPDHLKIMPIIVGLSTYLSTKTMPTGQNEQAKMMNYIMPVMLTFVSMSFGAGLQLYWVVSSLVAAAQQAYIQRIKA